MTPPPTSSPDATSSGQSQSTQLATLMSQELEARGFAGADMGRVADAIGSIWEHRDDLLDVIDWIRDHRDAITDLLAKLPDLVADAGSGIAQAGENAVAAAKFLIGGESDDEFSAVDLAKGAADAIDRCREELNDAQKLIQNLGDEVDAITVPSIRPKYVKVAGLSVIAGLDIGESNLADDAANKIRGGAERLGGVSAGLETVSEQLRKLGGAVTDAGSKLHAVGAFLQDSGGQLSGITQSLAAPASRSVARPAVSRSDAAGGSGTADLGSVPSISLASESANADAEPASAGGEASKTARKAAKRKTPPKGR